MKKILFAGIALLAALLCGCSENENITNDKPAIDEVVGDEIDAADEDVEDWVENNDDDEYNEEYNEDMYPL